MSPLIETPTTEPADYTEKSLDEAIKYFVNLRGAHLKPAERLKLLAQVRYQAKRAILKAGGQ